MPSSSKQRHGYALLVVLVALMFVTAMSAEMLRRDLLERRELNAVGRRQQADEYLATAERLLAARTAADPAYGGETWQPPHEKSSGPVRIVLAPDGGNGWTIDLDWQYRPGRRLLRTRLIGTVPGKEGSP